VATDRPSKDVAAVVRCCPIADEQAVIAPIEIEVCEVFPHCYEALDVVCPSLRTECVTIGEAVTTELACAALTADQCGLR
jgi:hypothetical protein